MRSEMQEILVHIPPFDPGAQDDADEKIRDELREGNGGDREGMDVSNLEASSSTAGPPAVAGHRITRSKFLVTSTAW